MYNTLSNKLITILVVK